jgi:hypothetical protein
MFNRICIYDYECGQRLKYYSPALILQIRHYKTYIIKIFFIDIFARIYS